MDLTLSAACIFSLNTAPVQLLKVQLMCQSKSVYIIDCKVATLNDVHCQGLFTSLYAHLTVFHAIDCPGSSFRTNTPDTYGN